MGTFSDAKRDAKDFAKLVNEDTDVDTRYGGVKPSYIKKLNQLAANFNLTPAFNFADGFIIETRNQAGLAADGNYWIYNGELPFQVAAGTTPSEPNYKKVTFSEAQNVVLSTGQSVQSFADSFALKIFQSPTDGGLTEIQTHTVDAGEVYEVRKTSDDSLATIYSDAAGLIEIAQDGTGNVSDSKGVVNLFINDGYYYISSSSSSSNFNVLNNSKIDITSVNLDGSKNQPENIYQLILSGKEFIVPKRIATLKGQTAKWKSGLKAPIAFFGDSTTDGRVSTTNGVDEVTIYNISRLVNDQVPDGLVYDHDDTEAPNAYPNILQRMARELFNNNNIRTYNAGYRGMQLQDGWATDNVYNAVYGNSTYADCEMIAINFGLNDSNFANSNILRVNTYNYTLALILDAYARGVQPFLMTCNITNKTGTIDYGENEEAINIIDNVKRQLAREYNLEIIDMHEMFVDYLSINKDGFGFKDISPDDLHVNDYGHLKQAEYMLKEMAGNYIPSVGGHTKQFDCGSAAMQYEFDSSTLSSADPSRGLNKTLRNAVLDNSKLQQVAGRYIFNLWVWNESATTKVFYDTPISFGYDPDYSSEENLPQLQLSAFNFTLNDYNKETIFSAPSPAHTTATSYSSMSTKFDIGTLKYGLNLIQMSVPSTLDASFASTVAAWFGGLVIAPKSKKGTVIRGGDNPNTYSKTNDVGFNYIMNQGGTGYSAMFQEELPDMSNILSTSNIGDYYDVIVKMDELESAGAIVSWSYYENRSSIYSSKTEYQAGTYLVVYMRSGELRVSAVKPSDGAPDAADTVLNELITTGDVGGKYITVRVERSASKELTISVLSEDLTVIKSEAYSYTTNESKYRSLGNFVAGVCGGAWVNRDLQTGVFSVDYIGCRNN